MSEILNRVCVLEWSRCLDGKSKYRLVVQTRDCHPSPAVFVEEREFDAMGQPSWRPAKSDTTAFDLLRSLALDLAEDQLRIVPGKPSIT